MRTGHQSYAGKIDEGQFIRPHRIGRLEVWEGVRRRRGRLLHAVADAPASIASGRKRRRQTIASENTASGPASGRRVIIGTRWSGRSGLGMEIAGVAGRSGDRTGSGEVV